MIASPLQSPCPSYWELPITHSHQLNQFLFFTNHSVCEIRSRQQKAVLKHSLFLVSHLKLPNPWNYVIKFDSDSRDSWLVIFPRLMWMHTYPYNSWDLHKCSAMRPFWMQRLFVINLLQWNGFSSGICFTDGRNACQTVIVEVLFSVNSRQLLDCYATCGHLITTSFSNITQFILSCSFTKE